MKKILISTSGSGGHTVPIKWVVKAIRKLDQDVELSFIGAKNDKTAKVLEEDFEHSYFHRIRTGKYRRYASQTKIQKIMDWQTNYKNTTDMFKFVVGLRSAYRLLKQIQPDVVLIKGGSVALPVGLAANYLKIPLITHDSDTIPGISNRIAGKKAVLNLVASKEGSYPYDEANIQVTGVPISSSIKPVTEDQQRAAKEALGFDPDMPLLFVSGGSLGSVSINSAMISVGKYLFENGVQVLHQCGELHYPEFKDEKLWDVRPFISPDEMITAFAAMDFMLARASATLTHEVSAAKKPLIAVPASQLYDQVSNAKHLAESGAAIMFTDHQLRTTPRILQEEVIDLVNNPERAQQLAERIHELHNPDSAKDIAKHVLGVLNAGS